MGFLHFAKAPVEMTILSEITCLFLLNNKNEEANQSLWNARHAKHQRFNRYRD